MKDSFSSRRAKNLDKVYKKYGFNVPWEGLGLPKIIFNTLKTLPKSKRIIITGCGLGQHAQNVKKLGFKNIIATDFSEEAIKSAKKRYSGIEFKVMRTQDVYKLGYTNSTVLDVHNLHQIKKSDLKAYINSIEKIADLAIITWIAPKGKLKQAKSDIPEIGAIYFHNPKLVKSKFKRLMRIKSFSYYLKNNPKFWKQKNLPTKKEKFCGLVFRKEK